MLIRIPPTLIQREVHCSLPSVSITMVSSNSGRCSSRYPQWINSFVKFYGTQKAISELLKHATAETILLSRSQYIFALFLSVFQVIWAHSMPSSPPMVYWFAFHFRLHVFLIMVNLILFFSVQCISIVPKAKTSKSLCRELLPLPTSSSRRVLETASLLRVCFTFCVSWCSHTQMCIVCFSCLFTQKVAHYI